MIYSCDIKISVWWEGNKKPTVKEVKQVVCENIKDYMIDACIQFEKVKWKPK